MTNVKVGKKTLAIAFLACLCVALLASTAYGFYYTHNEDAGNADGQGVIEVVCTVDETAQGGAITTDLMFLPVGSTADAVLDEAVMSSESQNGLDAIHNYDVTTLGEYLQGKNYTIAVYDPADQAAGTHTIYDGASKGDGSTTLDRFYSVVVTVA